MSKALFPDLIVNGEQVPHAVIAAETQNQTAPVGKPGIAWRKASRAIAIRTLLLQEARRRGVLAEPQAIAAQRYETKEDALIRGLLDEVIDVAPPSASQIRAEWEKDPSRFRAPPLWEVSHILCACDPRDADDCAKALARAEGILALAQGHPKGFAALAARESDCGSKSAGGALGQLGPNDTVPEFEAALRALGEGEITAAPVLSRHGYHIIRLDAVAEGQVLPFDVVSAKIATAIEKAAWAQKSRAFVGALVAEAHIQGADLSLV
ncbi:MAG: peptidylprolyl isomerase [Roseobacter sp.]|nr:peptidylprolyl isomerase [Roseobacter sp.]